MASNPRFPVYIVSKGRHESRLTVRTLDRCGVPFRIIVEAQELDAYAAVIPRERILVLDPRYQQQYDTCDKLGLTKSTGPGPARNFAWDHAVRAGAAWHWVMDDNIRYFAFLRDNLKIPVGDGTALAAMEDWALRYENVGMVGPQYCMFVPRKVYVPPVVFNTRIYSCQLIRNDLPMRWRARYNEDTDLSLRMLKAGWCTAQFNAFLQYKTPTQLMGGGNTADFYAREGTEPKSRMLVELHPDCARMAWRFGRIHHHVDYRRFKAMKLKLKPGVAVPDEPNDYGLRVKQVEPRRAAR